MYLSVMRIHSETLPLTPPTTQVGMELYIVTPLGKGSAPRHLCGKFA